MNVDISNRQTHVALRGQHIRQLARFFMQRVAQSNPRVEWKDFSLVLADDNALLELNRRFFGRNETTDVMAFPYERLPGEPLHGSGGEVVVNAQQARRYGAKRGNVVRELALYIAHGCDHLAGAEDDSPARRRRMRQRELRWLRQARNLGLLPDAGDQRPRQSSRASRRCRSS
jgi:rRNA maturation RNase YbeY